MTEPLSPTVTAGYSHPNAAVRHSYPLAITNGDFSTALSLLRQTTPYMLARLGALVLTALASTLWWLIALGGASFFSTHVNGVAALIWFIGWAVAFRWTWRAAVRYFLFLLKAGHIAVLTELITHGRVSQAGEPMFEYGKRMVTERLGQIHALFALEVMITGIVQVFHRTLDWISGLVPIPGARDIVGLVHQVVRAATSYVDETLLSYSLARGDEDHFRSASDGVIYYAQNSREVLKASIWIVLLDKCTSGVLWLILFIPAMLLASLFPESSKGLAVLFAAGLSFMLTWAIRGAVLEPLCLTMVMIKFHVCVRGQPINLAWDDRLSQLSQQFVALKDKIGQSPARRPATADAGPDSGLATL